VTKVCSKCEKEKPLTDFRSRCGDQKHLVKSWCNQCHYQAHKNWISRNPDRVREYRNKDKWTLVKRCARRGITPEQLATAYEQQGGKCPICTNPIELMDSAIDHNHQSGEFRGILCKTCNRALGLFRDNPDILKSAAAYLELKGDYRDAT
jgi:hypothetical protein